MIRTFLLLPLLVLGGGAGDAPAPAGDARLPVVQLSSARPLPALSARVVDQAEILTAPAEAELGARLEALEKETTDQLVMVTVGSLESETVEDLGLRLGNGWRIGRKGVDNGVLLIVAPADRRARIEVGKGLEGLLTDARAQRIMDEQVIPECREGRCDRGIADAVAAIATLLKSDPVRPQPRPEG